MKNERKLEWQIALTMILTAIICAAGAVAMVASVFFGWGAAV